MPHSKLPIPAFFSLLRSRAIKSLKNIISLVTSAQTKLKGYRVFLITLLVSASVAILSISVNDLPRKSIDSTQYPREHKSSQWYAENQSSDQKLLPLNHSVTGIFVEKMYDLDLSKSTFRAKGYIWSKWSGDLKLWNLQPWPTQDPLDGVYMNSTNKHDATYDGEGYTYKSAKEGWRYTYRQFDAEFESELDLKKYPFDNQKLYITIYHDIEASVLRTSIDKDSTVQWNASSFKEYSMVDKSFKDLIYEYPTRFGFTDYEPSETRMYVVPAIKAEIVLRKSIQSGFVKEILPPLLVSLLLMVNTIAPNEQWEEIKAALPSAVLLSLIFLQQGYQSKIPTLNYLTFMDIYYMMLYLLTIYMAVEVIAAYRLKNNAPMLARLKLATKFIFISLALIGPLFAFVLI